MQPRTGIGRRFTGLRDASSETQDLSHTTVTRRRQDAAAFAVRPQAEHDFLEQQAEIAPIGGDTRPRIR
jgi:hypothetical protein